MAQLGGCRLGGLRETMTDKHPDRRIDGGTDRQRNGQTIGQTDRETDGRMVGRMDGWRLGQLGWLAG